MGYQLIHPDGRDVDHHPFYEVVCGERRVRALTSVLGWDEIPCLVRELSDEQAAAVMLAENLARADLTPIEEALAYRRRLDRFGGTVKALAVQAGVSVARVNDRLALLQLAPDVQALVASGEVSVRHGVRMYQLDVDRQRIAVRDLHGQALDWQQFTVLCERLAMEQFSERLFALDAGLIAEEYVDKVLPPARMSRAKLLELVATLADALEGDGREDLVVVARQVVDRG